MPPVSWSKIIVATILQTLVLGGIYFYSLYYRLSHVNPQEFFACANQDLREMQVCANRMMFDYLTDVPWLSIQFTLVVVPAAVIAYLFCYQGIARPFTQSMFIALLTIFGLTAVLKQGALAAVAALIGIILGGLLAKRRLDRVIIINQKSQN